jgi:hypothetical protein
LSNTLPDGALCGDWLVVANQYEADSEICLLEQAAGVEFCGCAQPPNAQTCDICGGTTALPDARGLTCESLVAMVNIDGFRTCNILSTKYSALCACANAVDQPCRFCPTDIDFSVNKPFPTDIDLSVPLANVFGDFTDLSCEGLADIYAVQTTDSCSAIGSNLFGMSQFDLRAWCECPGVPPPQVCGDLCVAGTTVPDDRQDLVPDSELGLTCSELDGRVKYLSNTSACASIQALRPLCCSSAPPPTTATPTTGAPTSATPTVQPGNPTARPSVKPSPRPTSTTQPTAGPSQLPTNNPTTSQPTTENPTVTPGSPSASPTTGAPTTQPPTTARPTVSPTRNVNVVPVNSTFRMYNTDGLTSVEASQPGNALVLNTAWIDFVANIVADLETQKTRLLRSGRRLEVTLIPNTTTLDGIMDVTCPSDDPTIPQGSNCQNVLGRYDLNVADEDTAAVQEKYTQETANAIDAGRLQESLVATDPKSPFTIAGSATDVGNVKEEKMEWWLILIIVLSCLIGVVGIACVVYFYTRPKPKPAEQELALKLIEEDERPPDYANPVNAEHTVAGESDGHNDDSYDDEDSRTPSERWREPDPTVTVYADYVSDHDDQESRSEGGSEEEDDDELASLPNTLFNDDDDKDDEQSNCVSEMTNPVFDGPVDSDVENEAFRGENSDNDPPDGEVDGDPPECSRSQRVGLGEDPPVWPTGRDPSVTATSASLTPDSKGVLQENDGLASDGDQANDSNDSELEDDVNHKDGVDGDDTHDASSNLVYSMSVSSRGMLDMLDDSTAGRSEDTDALMAEAARELAGNTQT